MTTLTQTLTQIAAQMPEGTRQDCADAVLNAIYEQCPSNLPPDTAVGVVGVSVAQAVANLMQKAAIVNPLAGADSDASARSVADFVAQQIVLAVQRNRKPIGMNGFKPVFGP